MTVRVIPGAERRASCGCAFVLAAEFELGDPLAVTATLPIVVPCKTEGHLELARAAGETLEGQEAGYATDELEAIVEVFEASLR